MKQIYYDIAKVVSCYYACWIRNLKTAFAGPPHTNIIEAGAYVAPVDRQLEAKLIPIVYPFLAAFSFVFPDSIFLLFVYNLF